MAVVVLALIGAVLVAVGVGMWSLPAGVVIAGVQSMAGAYVIQYMKVRAAR
jgi:hypothetical protein